ncbi:MULTISPECIES: hypothetical protein [Halobacterium]|uniref:hypothetical protein n=1 Tax=Halobacterium TaxID=2239 RepID=UPI00073E7AD9|nr:MULTISPECIES: hypothetical protein [Halobacterium]MCG1001854.1 hypothetical protein [Halobacterium noricense]
MVTLDGDVLARYPRASFYNSPYPAHDAGCAVDLYPERAAGGSAGRATRAPSPVAGEVVETRTVRCPSKPYAADHDHLIVVDTGDYLARILHVAPAVEPGDTVDVGDDLGRLVRSGFFAPWVANHVHLGFRKRDADAVRASGSLPLELDAPVEAVPWDGTGNVVEVGETYALLDAPEHPAPGEALAGVATDDGRVLDGGLPHYDDGGVFGPETDSEVSFLGTTVADVTNGRTIEWRDVTVTANGEQIRGLSLWLGADRLGVKLVAPDHDFAVGDRVTVGVS